MPIPANAPDDERASPFLYVSYIGAQVFQRQLCGLDVREEIYDVLTSIDEKDCGPTTDVYKSVQSELDSISKMTIVNALKAMDVKNPVAVATALGPRGSKAREFSEFCNHVTSLTFPEYNAEAVEKSHDLWRALELPVED